MASRCPRMERAASSWSTALQPSAFSRSFRLAKSDARPERARAKALSMVDSVIWRRSGVGRPHSAPWSLAGLQLAGGHLAAALIALQLVADLLALIQRAEARTFDRGHVNEHVVAAVVGFNEAEALGGVEPLNSTGRHLEYSLG